MKTFKEYLIESPDINSKELYHFTNYESAINIFTHNYLKVFKYPESIYKGLSTTTDKTISHGSKEVLIILNHHKIKQKYKTIPINSIVGIDESEILVVSDNPIINLDKYIDFIQIFYIKHSDEVYNECVKIVGKFANKHQIKYDF